MREQDSPSITEAIAKMMEAAQRLITQRIELFRMRAVAEASNAGRAASVMAIGGALALVGWLCVIAGASFALQWWIPMAVSFAGFGVLHLAVGAVMVGRSIAALKGSLEKAAMLDEHHDESSPPAALPPDNTEESRVDRRQSLQSRNRGGDRTEQARAL